MAPNEFKSEIHTGRPIFRPACGLPMTGIVKPKQKRAPHVCVLIQFAALNNTFYKEQSL
jgi:hypothetical protein